MPNIIKWDSQFIIYILQGHAQFDQHLTIAHNFLDEFKDELKPIEDAIGTETLTKRIIAKVKALSPNNKEFPEQYRTEFERLRLQWTEEASKVRGYHRTARLQMLQELYDETLAKPTDEKSFTETAKLTTLIKLISEMRAEGDKAQIQVKADAIGFTVRNETQDFFKMMSDSQLKEIEDARNANPPRPVQPIIERIIRDIRLNGDSGQASVGGSAVTNGTQPGADET